MNGEEDGGGGDGVCGSGDGGRPDAMSQTSMCARKLVNARTHAISLSRRKNARAFEKALTLARKLSNFLIGFGAIERRKPRAIPCMCVFRSCVVSFLRS